MLVLSLLPFLAFALGGPLTGRNPRCVTGRACCCQQMQSADSPLWRAMSTAGLLGSVPSDSQIGLQCDTITGAGSSAKCNSNTVCCNNTSMNGLINLGCSPVNIDL